VDFYQKHSANGDFELLFVSSDRDQKGMNEYMTGMNMPWPGLKLKNKQTAALKKQFGVKGIPCLVLLDENNEVLATSYTADGKYLGPQVALKKYQALHGR
jgi:nucleoredoxin